MTEEKIENKKTEEIKKIVEAPMEKAEIKENKKKDDENKEKAETKKDDSKDKKKQKAPKKEEASVKVEGARISAKKSVDVCRFIKGKKITIAIKELEEVVKGRKPIPYRGEYAHQHGKGISGGGFPKNVALVFLKLLKSLQANASQHGMEDTYVHFAKADRASRPFKGFGKFKAKRASITIKSKEEKNDGAKKK